MRSKGLDASVFRPVSTGQVLENLKPGERVISVNLIEHSPMADGELRESVESYDCEGVDDEGNKYNLSVTASTGVSATWLPYGQTNRQTAPNVRRGERVQVWQSGDEDKYYWTELGLDFNLRRGETVVIAFSNVFENDDVDNMSLDNCYFLEASTHLQHFLLQTNRSHGEKFAYTIQVDAKESMVSIQDDQNNHFLLDSANTVIRLHNADGTYLELNKKNIYGYAPDSIYGQALSSINFQTQQFNVKADNCNIVAETKIDGNCTVTKKLTAGSISTGGLKSKGDIDVDGVVNAKAFNRI